MKVHDLRPAPGSSRGRRRVGRGAYRACGHGGHGKRSLRCRDQQQLVAGAFGRLVEQPLIDQPAIQHVVEHCNRSRDGRGMGVGHVDGAGAKPDALGRGRDPGKEGDR